MPMARNPVLAILTVLFLTLTLGPGAAITAGAAAPQGSAPAAKNGAKALPLVVVVSTGGTIAGAGASAGAAAGAGVAGVGVWVVASTGWVTAQPRTSCSYRDTTQPGAKGPVHRRRL